MNFEKIYNEALDLYPSEIDISDGNPTPEDNGFDSKTLFSVYENADIKAASLGEWHLLLVWIIYQVLHEEARKSFLNNYFILYRELDKKRVKELLLRNLEVAEYQDMKLEYLKSISQN